MKKIFLSCLLAAGLASCEDITELNNDPKATTEAPYTAVFTSAEIALADVMTSTNVNLNVFRLYSQQWTQVTYIDESNYNLTSRAIPDNFWDEVYTDVLRDLAEADVLIDAVPDVVLGAEQRANEEAAIEVLSVYAWATLIQVYGDVPYEEALNVENLLPAYTEAEVIHADLITRLNDAIAALEAGVGAPTFPNSDLIYGGDTEMWLRFANSLKLKLGILVADSNPSLAQEVIGSIDTDMLITANVFNANFDYLSAPPYTNPVWVDLVQSGRNDYVPSATIVDLMNLLDDPRRDDYFTMLNGEFIGDEYGSGASYANFSHVAPALTEPTYPGMLMSASEVNFYLAEAAARWSGIVPAPAEAYYEAGIMTSMLQYGNTVEMAELYMDQPLVEYNNDNWDELIGVQSYIAAYNRGLVAWTNWRRLDFPLFDPPGDLAYEDIPVRFLYPVGEQNLNTANYEAAVSGLEDGDTQTSNLFFDVD
ncbi:SusD/RagB family nutrient-binding outer membrane lipoprotein [Nafulsella turpanensis]|uniref:SusD/RagB family nutrient-binding outer membrane lipoprotein n=1 Tax=Nafulsella turpanensis TaxID=1265690 RepID=UPI0003466B66|nr:SusD/RagB family nutrient-binding outer membrane lipoprotein [Nafulsella turpanensis]